MRKSHGLTLAALGEKVGVSYRMIAYYELESKYPPAHLIIPLAKALKVSADELLGIKELKYQINPKYPSLWRRLKKVESLSKSDQKALLKMIDGLLAKNKAK